MATKRKGPSLSYAAWCDRVGRSAGKFGTVIAFGPGTHEAWLRGVKPDQFAKEAPVSRLSHSLDDPRRRGPLSEAELDRIVRELNPKG